MAWIPLRLSNYQQVAPLVRTGGSRHTGLAAPPHRNIHPAIPAVNFAVFRAAAPGIPEVLWRIPADGILRISDIRLS